MMIASTSRSPSAVAIPRCVIRSIGSVTNSTFSRLKVRR
jgi:hypothetical protein